MSNPGWVIEKNTKAMTAIAIARTSSAGTCGRVIGVAALCNPEHRHTDHDGKTFDQLPGPGA